MREYLLFQLHGPLASWGSIAVGQERPSDTHPGKSAVTGLLAAALGIRRNEETVLRQLAECYGLAVRVDAPGQLLRDYHTAQVPPERRKTRYHTRYDEIHSGNLKTILSGREYRCDALYIVALWARPERQPTFSLAELAGALKRPVFCLYLGRKSCPPSIPLQAQTLSAANLVEAFENAVFTADPENLIRHFDNSVEPTVTLRRNPAQTLIYWDEDAEAGNLKAIQVLTRRDQPTNRLRWQFAPRREWQAGTSLK